MPWAKGQSGNPHGKRLGKPLTDALHLELSADPKLARRIAKALLAAAASGDTKAANLVFDRVDGAVVRQLEALVENVHPIERASEDEKRRHLRELLDTARSKATDLVPVQPRGIAKP
jgi:hypothetical protein